MRKKQKNKQKKKQRKWFIDNVWRWAGREGGACADGVFPVSVVVIMCLWQGGRVACIYKGFDYFSFKGAGRGRGEGGVWIHVRGRSDEWREEQMNWMAEEQFWYFWKNKKGKQTSLALQRHHVAVWCKLLTRTKHVILMLFLCSNHIINKVIKYCCPPSPWVRSLTAAWPAARVRVKFTWRSSQAAGLKGQAAGRLIMLVMHWPSIEEMRL